MRSFLIKNKKKLTGILVFALVLTCSLPTLAFAEVTPVPVDYGAVTSSLTSIFSVAEMLKLVGIIVGASGGLAIAWFGARKIVRGVMSAFKKGKIGF